MKINLFKVYPFNLSLDIFENEADAKAIYVDGLLNEVSLLKELERTAITLRYEQDCTIKEISEKMNRSPVTVSHILLKTIRKLRGHLCTPQFRAVSIADYRLLAGEIREFKRNLEEVKEALKEALDEQFPDERIPGVAKDIAQYRALMETLVSDLGMGHNIQGNLIKADISNVRELKNYSFEELKALEGIGKKSAEIIIETLENLGIPSKSKKISKEKGE